MSTTEDTTADRTDDPWDRLAEKRDVFETIIEKDLPLTPEAKAILQVLDERDGQDNQEDSDR
ncbi:hypothetical protein GWK26_12845 [haloarchaeon 3A1-DGR]|nr:hypothetical protein GWK26_12845 [haloarchaeon 3A1-DGR]